MRVSSVFTIKWGNWRGLSFLRPQIAIMKHLNHCFWSIFLNHFCAKAFLWRLRIEVKIAFWLTFSAFIKSFSSWVSILVIPKTLVISSPISYLSGLRPSASKVIIKPWLITPHIFKLRTRYFLFSKNAKGSVGGVWLSISI